MTLSPSTARFIQSLTAQVADTLTWWAANHPGRPLNPDVATGLCPRRVPVTRDGRKLLTVDEVLWRWGRTRYGVRR